MGFGRAAPAVEARSSRALSPGDTAERADAGSSTRTEGWGVGDVGQHPEITHATSPAISCFKPRASGESPRETWRRQDESAARRGARPGHSRARAREKAVTARVAANGCELELDPGNQALFRELLTPHKGRCYSGDLTVLPCKVKTFCKLLESNIRSGGGNFPPVLPRASTFLSK